MLESSSRRELESLEGLWIALGEVENGSRWSHCLEVDGLKPIQVAATRGNRSAVEILFPLISKLETIPKWTVDGILEYMQCETSSQQVPRS
ncbi:putative ankyrin repeat protein isoform X2 [Prunus yedoensis var. nudiflora]|uniref:Putative ankyrin repeat protein isoform X2 n=1 Tax=Prunus yedoensis var. nudiflora TaxID=2094558 RepID=A0A314Y5F4_PRUYE|nr:putative ankyrin repeat protein isoform X2 [Prunus yedoensis var. nudiflora]